MKLGLLLAFLTLTSCTEYRDQIEIRDDDSAFFVAGMEPVPLFSEPRADSTVLLSLKPGTNLRADLSLMIEPRFFGDQEQWLHIMDESLHDRLGPEDLHSGPSGWIRRADIESGSLGRSLDEDSKRYGPYRIQVRQSRCPFPEFNRCLYFTAAGYPYAECYVGRDFTVIVVQGSIGVRKTTKGRGQCELQASEWLMATAGQLAGYEAGKVAVLQGAFGVWDETRDIKPARLHLWNLTEPSLSYRIVLPDAESLSIGSDDEATTGMNFTYSTECGSKKSDHQEWKRCVDGELQEANLPFSVPMNEMCGGSTEYSFWVKPDLDTASFQYMDLKFECRRWQ